MQEGVAMSLSTNSLSLPATPLHATGLSQRSKIDCHRDHRELQREEKGWELPISLAQAVLEALNTTIIITEEEIQKCCLTEGIWMMGLNEPKLQFFVI